LSIPDAGSARAKWHGGRCDESLIPLAFRYTLTCYGTALKSASEPRKFVMRGKATLRRELVNQAR